MDAVPKLSADDCADSTTGTLLGQIADALRGMAPGHLAGIEDESERCGSERDLAADVELLEGLGALLAPVDILGQGLRRDYEDLNQTVNPPCDVSGHYYYASGHGRAHAETHVGLGSDLPLCD